MSVFWTKNEIGKLERIVEEELLAAGVAHVLIVDMSGNLLLERGSMLMEDTLSLAVLSAANFAATLEIARLIGEEDFTLLFHKGDKRNIHFSRLGNEYIIVTLFNEGISLGLIRLKLNKAIERMLSVFDGAEGKARGLYRPE